MRKGRSRINLSWSTPNSGSSRSGHLERGDGASTSRPATQSGKLNEAGTFRPAWSKSVASRDGREHGHGGHTQNDHGGIRHVCAPASFGGAFSLGIDLDSVFVGHRMQRVAQVFDQGDDAQN
jgi:hypothetical protein